MGKIVRRVVRIGDKPTPEQIKEIEEAAKMEPVYDEDFPDFTYEEMLELVEATKRMREERKKEVITLRISPSALKKAKAAGKGYTGFLSRLVENALNDKELVRRSL